jgi:hypothetical protein
MQAYNQALMQSTGIGDDALIALQGTLVSYGVLAEDLAEATKATIGLSEATGKDLISAGREVARLYAGDVSRSIKQMHLGAADASGILRELASMSELASARTESFGGQVALLGENLGELQEAIGSAVTQFPGIVGALRSVNEALLGTVRATEEIGAGFKSVVEDVAAFLPTVPAWAQTLIERGIAGIPGVGQAKLALDALSAGFGAMAERGRAAREEAEATADALNVGDIGSKAWDPMAGTKLEGAPAARGGRGGRGAGLEGGMSDRARALLEEGEQIRAAQQAEVDRAVAHEEAMIALELGFAEQQNAIRGEVAAAELDAQRAANESRFQEEIRAHDERMNLAQRQAAEAEQQQLLSWQMIGRTAVGGVAGVLASSIAAAAKGGEDLDNVIGQAFGTMLTTLGSTMVSIGVTALAAAAAAAFFPFLRPILGNPEVSVPAAIGLIAAGGAAIAAGAALGASASGGSSAPSGGGGGGGVTGFSPTGFGDPFGGNFGAQGGGPRSTTVIINAGVVGGDPRRVGAEIARLLEDAGSLDPTGGR